MCLVPRRKFYSSDLPEELRVARATTRIAPRRPADRLDRTAGNRSGVMENRHSSVPKGTWFCPASIKFLWRYSTEGYPLVAKWFRGGFMEWLFWIVLAGVLTYLGSRTLSASRKKTDAPTGPKSLPRADAGEIPTSGGLGSIRRRRDEERVRILIAADARLVSKPPPLIARFTVYHPKEITPERWDSMLVYAHIPDKQDWVDVDAQARLDQSGSYGQKGARAKSDIAEGADIAVVPELPGCEFNPRVDRFRWLEDVHRREFRLRATPAAPGFAPGMAVNGRVAFYVASILIAEIGVWAFISDRQPATRSMIMHLPAAASAPTGTSHTRGTADPYSAIFVSYAHEDGAIVDRIGAAYKVLGMNFLRDQEILRSGERWNPALLALIERADIFQLFWSNAARRSRYVKQEWRQALKQERDYFIRPMYWQQPLPRPPSELRHLHFAYLPAIASRMGVSEPAAGDRRVEEIPLQH